MWDYSTVNGWIQREGPINLRHTERKPVVDRNMERVARGAIVGALVGLFFWVFLYMLWLIIR